jgi:hypothetical protein
MRRFFFLLVLFCLAAHPTSAQDAMYRVVETEGRAEFSDAPGRWVPLVKGMGVVAGTKLRTGKESFADLVRDAYFENSMRVGPSSSVSFLNAHPVRLSLDEGVLYLLKEEYRFLSPDTGTPSGIRILTRDFLVELREGGCRLESSDEGAVLKVFSETVGVQRKALQGYSETVEAVEEGLLFRLSGRMRMEYPHYEDWRTWYRKNDERKDKAGHG